MVKEVTEYSVVKTYSRPTTLVLIDAQVLLESFPDDDVWARFQAETRETFGTAPRIKEETFIISDVYDRFFKYVGANIDAKGTDDSKVYVNVVNVKSGELKGRIRIKSGWVLCIPFNEVEWLLKHIEGKEWVSVNVEANAQTCMIYRTGSTFSNNPTTSIRIIENIPDVGCGYKVICNVRNTDV